MIITNNWYKYPDSNDIADVKLMSQSSNRPRSIWGVDELQRNEPFFITGHDNRISELQHPVLGVRPESVLMTSTSNQDGSSCCNNDQKNPDTS